MKKQFMITFALVMALLMCACSAAPAAPAATVAPSAAPAASPAASPAAPVAPESPAATVAVPAADTSLDDVKAKGQLIIGMDDSFPPMGFRDKDNKLCGFDVDLAMEVASRMGVELVPTPIDWSQKLIELDTGNIDAIWNGFTITDSRLEETEMTFSYMKNRQVVVVTADSAIKALADLSGKTISLQADSSAEAALDGAADFKASLKDIVLLNNNADALRDLEVGGCDAVLMDEVVANYYITEGSAYRVLDESLADEEYGIGARKGAVSLKNEIEAQLTAMAKDGKLAEIANKWFGKDLTTVAK